MVEESLSEGSRRWEYPGLRARGSGESLTDVGSLTYGPDSWEITASAVGRQATQTFKRVQQRSMCMKTSTLALLSFDGQEHLRRGSSLSVLLHGGGGIFRDRAGSAETYALSEQVGKIDAFVSHNWCVPRYQKYIALSLHFNIAIASWTTALTMAALTAAGAAGAPVPTLAAFPGDYPRGVCCRIVGVPTFLLTLLLCRELGHHIGFRGPTMFLDKTCIHQVDANLQRQGISKLGAFIFSSRQMVIIYSDFYLRKLWTVYEVATFLVLHPVDRMTVLPASLSCTILVGLVCLYIANICAMVFEYLFAFKYTFDIVALAMSYGLVRALRQYAREKLEIHVRLARFTVRDCTCLVEDDRPVVYDWIASLMRESQIVSEDADDDKALARFDRLVRAVLPQAIVGSMGRSTMKLNHCIMLGVLGFLPYFLDKQVGWAHGMTVRYLVTDMLWYLTVCCAIVPICLAGMLTLARRCMSLGACQDHLYSMLIVLCSGAFAFGAIWALDELMVWGLEEDEGIVAEAVVCLLMFALVFVLYRPQGAKQAASSVVPGATGPDGLRTAWGSAADAEELN